MTALRRMAIMLWGLWTRRRGGKEMTMTDIVRPMARNGLRQMKRCGS